MPTAPKPIRIAQITDTHLLQHPDGLLRGWATNHSCQRILDQAITYKPNALLLTGDLADTGDAAAYQQLQELLAPLPIPSYCLPGNHDDAAVMQSVLQAPTIHHVDAVKIGFWQLLCLNSVLPTAQYGEGIITSQTLAWLELQLQTRVKHPTLIALHHHPIATGIDWLDLMQAKNSQVFIELLEAYEQVKVVVFGHIHHALAAEHIVSTQDRIIHFYGCPSSCHQVVIDPNNKMEQLPGFRLLDLYPNGCHTTWVQRVAVQPTTTITSAE